MITVGISVGEIYSQVDWLRALAATTVEELLCKGQSLGRGLASAGLWYQMNLPLECVAHSRVWVVLPCGLKLTAGWDGRCRPRSVATCALPRGT